MTNAFYSLGDNCDDSEAEEDTCPRDQKQEPEPKEDVDLLIDDVKRQNTETVVVNDCSRRSILVECT